MRSRRHHPLIPHTQSQIVALPVVPDNVQPEVDCSHKYHEKQQNCVFCTLIDEALNFETRVYDRESGEVRRRIDVGLYVIERGRRFIAIKPFANRHEREIQILPLVYQADFMDCSRKDAAAKLSPLPVVNFATDRRASLKRPVQTVSRPAPD